jgi:hypothetical protein
MPVDLTCIPPRAKRQSAPSFKRWVILLVVLIVAGAGITALFWPMNSPTHTPTFWFCFLGIPLAAGGVAFAFRWLFYLAGDGWQMAGMRPGSGILLRIFGPASVVSVC